MHDRYVQPYAVEADFTTEHGQPLAALADHIVDRLDVLVTARP
jgi:hypothetical protein